MTNLHNRFGRYRRPLFAFALFAAAAATFAAPTAAQAHKELGRMWTFEHAPLGWFQEAYDWQPSQEWLDHARMSSLRLGNGDRYFCSASFVSPYGLIMTNHHCSRDFIAQVQGDHDWQTNGFYAGAYDNEIPIPGAKVSQLITQRDVTDAVHDQGEAAVLAAAREAQPELEHQIIGLYQGGNYQLYSHRIFNDLRLVCAPHGQSEVWVVVLGVVLVRAHVHDLVAGGVEMLGKLLFEREAAVVGSDEDAHRGKL